MPWLLMRGNRRWRWLGASARSDQPEDHTSARRGRKARGIRTVYTAGVPKGHIRAIASLGDKRDSFAVWLSGRRGARRVGAASGAGRGGDFKHAMRCQVNGRLARPIGDDAESREQGQRSAKKDKWGLPVLKIDCATGENERLMRRDMQVDMAELLEQSGVKDVGVYDAGYFPGMGIHEMGTARMGKDPKTSVLNSHNQVWDAPNVFVTDGSCMVSSACQNPSLTYMALTARAADYAVQELKRQTL